MLNFIKFFPFPPISPCRANGCLGSLGLLLFCIDLVAWPLRGSPWVWSCSSNHESDPARDSKYGEYVKQVSFNAFQYFFWFLAKIELGASTYAETPATESTKIFPLENLIARMFIFEHFDQIPTLSKFWPNANFHNKDTIVLFLMVWYYKMMCDVRMTHAH